MQMRKVLQSQRGAMFGMDARFALAVMAVITAIAGYYGLGKVSLAKQTAFIKELLAYEEALDAMQADFGVFMREAVNGGSNGTKDFQMLYDDTQVDADFKRYWAGPYVTREANTHPDYGTMTITYGTESRAACSISNNCFVWLDITNVDEPTWNRVNSYFDENLGDNIEGAPTTSGKVQASASSGIRTIYFRTIKRPE